MAAKEEILQLFPDYMRPVWEVAADHADKLQEIRLRAERPAAVTVDNEEWYISGAGGLTHNRGRSLVTTAQDMEAVLNHMCSYSLYAFEDELRQGFLTLPGGHRAGVAGQVIPGENGQVRNIKYVRYIHIRVAHEVKGAAERVLPFVYEGGVLCNTLIFSPPGCGKTTLLRDLVRQVSDGNPFGEGMNVGVVDERSEIAGGYMGTAQNDVGLRTDVLDACPKDVGMMMLIRSMGPQVVAVDEIGGERDMQAVRQVLLCGSRILATIHGNSPEDVRRKLGPDGVREKLFDRYVRLHREKGRFAVGGIYDQDFRLCSGF